MKGLCPWSKSIIWSDHGFNKGRLTHMDRNENRDLVMQSKKSENQSSKEVKPASKDHMWPPKSFLKPTIRNESWTHATAERETIRIRRDECPAVIRFTKRRMLTTCWIVSGLLNFVDWVLWRRTSSNFSLRKRQDDKRIDTPTSGCCIYV